MSNLFEEIGKTTRKRSGLRTIYGLKVRRNDSDDWSPATFYRSRKERDSDGAHCRIIAGFRTWSFDEKHSVVDAERLINV